MNDPISIPVLNGSDKYGAASKYDFDNPQKWHTEPSVPLLDEHEMTNEEGRPVAFVDRHILQEIANNNNKRVRETGDPATLILGHTSDDPRAEEKPAKGFVVNYHVKPFKRDPKTGQVIYAIHGDYKVRPQNASLIEEYPRRSVELWWNKKELDPIAMLGGTSPERDLSVVIRNARLNNVEMRRFGGLSSVRGIGGGQETDIIRFSTRGSRTIENYSIEHVLSRRQFAANGNGKVGKVMHEFKHGELHSGSKQGPKVTSREQAIAIAMSEAGKTKKSRGESMGTPRETIPDRYEMDDGECDEKMKYMAGDDDTGDFDPGDESPDPMGQTDSAENDPVLAKLFQSKQWKQLTSQMEMIAQALAPEQGQGDGMGMGDEMAPPGPGGPPPMGGQGPPPGPPGAPPPAAGPAGPPPDDGMDFGDEQAPDEEDSRRMHGSNPVQFNAPSTGFPGPMNTNIPTTPRKKMSRNGSAPVNGSPIQNGRRTSTNGDPVLVRMSAIEKENRSLHLKLARAEVKDDIRTLKDEGILFGTTPEIQAKKEEEHLELLANLKLQGEEHYQCELENIRACYARKKPNPAAPAYPGVARFARGQVANESAETPEDFEPETPQEANDLANMLTLKKMSRADAVAKIRLQRGQA